MSVPDHKEGLLFIFDWDGTLSDSKDLITRTMQQSARDLGLKAPPDEAVHNIIGLGMREALAHLFPEVDPEQYHLIRQRYSEHYLSGDLAQPTVLFPSVMETLTRLRDDGHLITIATGKSRQGLDRVLSAMKLDGFFHGSRCADETASKPHPLMLEELLLEFDHPAGEAVMLGDTEYDMDMARRIEMPRIAVSYGAHHIDRLRPFGPELCLDEFGELLNWRRL